MGPIIDLHRQPDGTYAMPRQRAERQKETSSLADAVAGAALIAACVFGPVDAARTGFNAVTGRLPELKTALVQYVRQGVRREYPHIGAHELEALVARELKTEIGPAGRIIPEEASTRRLWDASEKYAASGFERWLWPDLY